MKMVLLERKHRKYKLFLFIKLLTIASEILKHREVIKTANTGNIDIKVENSVKFLI
jgi:hypothetical protein